MYHFFSEDLFFLIYREDEAKHTMMRCIRWKINNQLGTQGMKYFFKPSQLFSSLIEHIFFLKSG